MKKILGFLFIIALIISGVHVTNQSKLKENNPNYYKDYEYYLKRISNDEEWMKLIEKEALGKGISTDSNLKIVAKDWAKN
tara:strand:- start:14 stop:253 length:240 start_codon:yes stop_codon:yes gene_type:complete